MRFSQELKRYRLVKAMDSRRSYKGESVSKFDFRLMATKMVGNDSSRHLRMFGEVSKPLSAEMSEIWIIGPNFNLSHYAQGHL